MGILKMLTTDELHDLSDCFWQSGSKKTFDDLLNGNLMKVVQSDKRDRYAQLETIWDVPTIVIWLKVSNQMKKMWYDGSTLLFKDTFKERLESDTL